MPGSAEARERQERPTRARHGRVSRYGQKSCGELRALVHNLVPGATEEVDASARLIGYTFRPGTYSGLIVAIAPQKSYVNLMFSKGAELVDVDSTQLLAGSGKKARHIKFHDLSRLTDPGVRALVEEAAKRTPRA